MAFKYSLKQKRLAKQNDNSTLQKAYANSENQLNYFARKGSNKDSPIKKTRISLNRGETVS